jgi:flagellar hook-length control protein FliK
VGAAATTPPRATAPADAARPPAAAAATGSAPPAPAPVAAEPGVDARSLATAAAGASATTVPPPAAEALRAAAAPRSGKASPASPSGPVDGAAKTAVSAVREAARGVETLVAGAPPAVEPGLATPATARHGGAPTALARGDAPASSPAEAGVDEVPAQIRRVAESGGRQLHVRLVPADLGRLDIRLDFDGEHGLKVQIRADNDQALDLLQRQGHQLERALQQSGFEVGRDAVRYELDTGGGRSARGGGGGAEGGGRGDGTPHPAGAEPDDGPADGAPEAPERGVEIRNVLDLHV